MAAALFSSILELLDTVVVEEAKQGVWLMGVPAEVGRLRNDLENFTEILIWAEEKKTIDKALELSIDEVRDAAYDLVDVFDGWNTELRMNGVGKTSNLRAKVGYFVTFCFHARQVVRRYDLAFKIKEIIGRLNASAIFNLAVGSVSQHSRRLESSPIVDVSALIGRDEVKADILSSLLYGSTEEESELLKIISVVGMGGVGKTAIAQLVYHDEAVKQHFHKRIWVCVSNVFGEIEVAKAITAEVEHVAVHSLDSVLFVTLHERIRRSIEGKKFFLVLDDARTDDRHDWKRLIETFKHGAPGSRILLTTRKDMVTNMMNIRVFQLEALSDEHCWMVFSQSASCGMGVEEFRNLEDIGRRISKKCKGLPLAAKTLGRLLSDKLSREEWEDILYSEIWEIEIARQEIFDPLLLSYDGLPWQLRECFKYCAIFPKDFLYNEETIIYHWMAQGYLGWDNSEDLELKGREYISYLAACSFFQDFRMDKDGLKSTWKMHDIVHDFARFLMINNGIVIEVMNPGGNSRIDLSSTKARYLTALIAEGCCLPTSIYGAEKLHSIVIISGENAITNEAVQIIFNQAKRLRLVDFGCHNALVGTIPKEIGNLIHLRHINLSGSTIKGLPRSSCDLHNLQYLNLNNCKSLENLPDEIGNLINLIYLGTLHCYKLACYPKSARRLTNLRQLCGIVLRADRNDAKEFALGDLENLNCLHELSMVLKGNAVNDRELKRAKFENKPDLKEIKVE
ncbi:hypothetical protein SLE2022_246230 [Rubroshorea leprosula]